MIEEIKDESFEENLNPFVGGGIVSRLQYFGIGMFNALVFHVPLHFILLEVEKDPNQDLPFLGLLLLLPALFYTSLINTFKRVRDIKGRQFRKSDKWKWGIGSFLPLVNLVLGLRLLFEKGRISSNLSHDA